MGSECIKGIASAAAAWGVIEVAILSCRTIQLERWTLDIGSRLRALRRCIPQHESAVIHWRWSVQHYDCAMVIAGYCSALRAIVSLLCH